MTASEGQSLGGSASSSYQ
ncbi:unnamed protein product [Cuscuta epithymum]|uniref:Uncharacterized protein n=1 Tax=Cuscuta epithymum TaxID=186058 RepID=A0AAV0EVP0_9ASTE|nr:unnamed protein product [Cuscuta epithymum]